MARSDGGSRKTGRSGRAAAASPKAASPKAASPKAPSRNAASPKAASARAASPEAAPPKAASSGSGAASTPAAARKPVRPPAESLAQRAARVIGTSIVRGEYQPGETLPVESEICLALGVGRNILREAVKILAGKGMIRTVRRAGTLVLPRASWSVLDADLVKWSLADDDLRGPLAADLLVLRATVLPDAAALAARRPAAAFVERLSAAVAAFEAAGSDRAQSVTAENRIAAELLTGSGNQAFAGLAAALGLALSAAPPPRRRAAAASYRAAADAIAARDPAAASAAVAAAIGVKRAGA